MAPCKLVTEANAWEELPTFLSTGPWARLVWHHARTLLLSLSLRFPGSHQAIVKECYESAMEAVQLVVNWPSAFPVIYTNNFIVLIIAYAIMVVLRVSSYLPFCGRLVPLKRTFCSAGGSGDFERRCHIGLNMEKLQ